MGAETDACSFGNDEEFAAAVDEEFQQFGRHTERFGVCSGLRITCLRFGLPKKVSAPATFWHGGVPVVASKKDEVHFVKEFVNNIKHWQMYTRFEYDVLQAIHDYSHVHDKLPPIMRRRLAANLVICGFLVYECGRVVNPEYPLHHESLPSVLAFPRHAALLRTLAQPS